MKKALHTVVLSTFLLASTQTMAANQSPVTEVSANSQQVQQNIPAKDQYNDLRHASANMSVQQTKETEAGYWPIVIAGVIAYEILFPNVAYAPGPNDYNK